MSTFLGNITPTRILNDDTISRLSGTVSYSDSTWDSVTSSVDSKGNVFSQGSQQVIYDIAPTFDLMFQEIGASVSWSQGVGTGKTITKVNCELTIQYTVEGGSGAKTLTVQYTDEKGLGITDPEDNGTWEEAYNAEPESITSLVQALIPDAVVGVELAPSTLAPDQSGLDFGYVSGSYGTLEGGLNGEVESIISNDTDIRVTFTGGVQYEELDTILLIWDLNEIILTWDAGGYYINNSIDAEIFTDHFERQLGISQTLEIIALPVRVAQAEVWERTASGSLQGEAFNEENISSNDLTWSTNQAGRGDPYGTSYAFGNTTVGNRFYTVEGGRPARDTTRKTGTSVAVVYLESVQGGSNGFPYQSLVSADDPSIRFDVSLTDWDLRATGVTPSGSIASDTHSLTSDAWHQVAVTTEPISATQSRLIAYVNGAQVASEVVADNGNGLVGIHNRFFLSNSNRVAQWIVDERVWTPTEINNHYNGGTFQLFTYPSNVVGVVHGDSLTNHPNRNTWDDTIGGFRWTWPSWTDYMRELNNKWLLGDGQESRTLANPGTAGVSRIQRFAHLPAGTRHFLYLGANNVIIDADSLLTMQTELQSAISEIETQGHEAILFNMPPAFYPSGRVTDAQAYDAWLTPWAESNGYKLIDPKIPLADPGTYNLKAEFNTTKAGADRPGTDPTHPNNYGHRTLAQYVSDQIDSW